MSVHRGRRVHATHRVLHTVHTSHHVFQPTVHRHRCVHASHHRALHTSSCHVNPTQTNRVRRIINNGIHNVPPEPRDWVSHFWRDRVLRDCWGGNLWFQLDCVLRRRQNGVFLHRHARLRLDWVLREGILLDHQCCRTMTMRNSKIFNPPVQSRIDRITVVNGMGQYGIRPYLLRPSSIEPKAQPVRYGYPYKIPV